MLKIINKLTKILTLIIKAKIIFRNPLKKDILIFDEMSKSELKNILRGKKNFFLPDFNRNIKIDKIFLSFPIIIETIKQILIGNIKISYYVAVIKAVNPNILLTFIDNNFTFFKITKYFKYKKKSISIQNAFRDLNNFTKKQTDQIYIDQFVCYGPQTKNHYLAKGAKVNNFHFFGSLRLANAEEFFLKKKIKFYKKKYDLCLVENSVLDKDFDNSYNAKKNKFLIFKTMLSYFTKITEEYNLNSIILLKSPNNNLFKKELKIYKNFMPENCKIKFIQRKHHKFSSYLASFKSKLVIGKSSSILLENLSKDQKILSCAFNFKKFTKYPFLNPLFKKNSLISLHNPSYFQFKKRVLNLLKMKDEIYIKKVSKIKKYMISYDKKRNTINKIRSLLY